jgi:hypothetical protein
VHAFAAELRDVDCRGRDGNPSINEAESFAKPRFFRTGLIRKWIFSLARGLRFTRYVLAGFAMGAGRSIGRHR